MNFQVADWHVDIDANRIQSRNETDGDTDKQDIKLESKVMALLVYLAKNQGSVVSREQLEAEVWTDRVISYDALTSCITRLRKALGDSSRNPVYIETVPKKGYRLIAPVSWGDADPAIDNSATGTSQVNERADTDQQEPANTRSIGYLISFVLILLVAVTAVVTITYRNTPDKVPLSLTDTPTIIVLPFENLSDDSSQSYFSDGITADISIALSKLSGLQVIATPSMPTGDREINDQRHMEAQQLARYTVTGSVQRAEDKLRVNVALIDNDTHHQFWAERYDREITAVFEVQDEITTKIISSLKIKLTEEEKSRVAKRYTNSIEAYDQFLRGQALYTQHSNNENLLARDHLNQAIQIDPNFARAYSTLALTYIDEYRYRWHSSTGAALTKTIHLAETAIAIDETLPQAYWPLAHAQLHLRRYEQAISTINHALNMNPNYADGYALLAIAYIYQGDPDSGMKMIRKAMRLNPNHPTQYISVLGQAYYYLQDYEYALRVFRDAIDKNFSILTAHIMQTATLSKLDIPEEANWSAEQLLIITPGFTATDIIRIFPLKAGKQRQDVLDQLKKAGI